MTNGAYELAVEIAGTAGFPSSRHVTALGYAVECWERGCGASDLKSCVRRRWREDLTNQNYGFVAIFLLLTVAGAAISWAVEKLLDWIYSRWDLRAARTERVLAAQS